MSLRSSRARITGTDCTRPLTIRRRGAVKKSTTHERTLIQENLPRCGVDDYVGPLFRGSYSPGVSALLGDLLRGGGHDLFRAGHPLVFFRRGTPQHACPDGTGRGS